MQILSLSKTRWSLRQEGIHWALPSNREPEAAADIFGCKNE